MSKKGYYIFNPFSNQKDFITASKLNMITNMNFQDLFNIIDNRLFVRGLGYILPIDTPEEVFKELESRKSWVQLTIPYKCDYEISNYGEVRRVYSSGEKGEILTPKLNITENRYYVVLRLDESTYNLYLDTAVVKHFFFSKDDPYNAIEYLDGDSSNLYYKNLRSIPNEELAEDEEWKKIKRKDSDYEISNYGKIREIINGRYQYIKIVRRRDTNRLSAFLTFYDGGKYYEIDRLVAKYFIDDYSDEVGINFIDGDSSNLHYKNLYIIPSKIAEDEQWKKINREDCDYEISNYGRIRTILNNRYEYIKASKKKKLNALGVALFHNNKEHLYELSKLVAEHFIEGYSEEAEIFFIDRDKENLCYKNLKIVYESDKKWERIRIPYECDYEISNFGEVREINSDKSTGKFLKIKLNRTENRYYVTLELKEERFTLYLDTAVMYHFSNTLYTLYEHVDYIDGNSLNLQHDNLYSISNKKATDEVWKKIEKEGSNYEISNYGRVRTVINCRHKYLKVIPKGNSDSLNVSLSCNKVKKFYSVSRLVAEHFLDDFSEENSVAFKDGDKTNLYYKNLEIISKEELGKRTGALARKLPLVVCIEKETGKEIGTYTSAREASRELGINRQSISDNLNGKSKLVARKYIFRYTD